MKQKPNLFTMTDAATKLASAIPPRRIESVRALTTREKTIGVEVGMIPADATSFVILKDASPVYAVEDVDTLTARANGSVDQRTEEAVAMLKVCLEFVGLFTGNGSPCKNWPEWWDHDARQGDSRNEDRLRAEIEKVIAKADAA